MNHSFFANQQKRDEKKNCKNVFWCVVVVVVVVVVGVNVVDDVDINDENVCRRASKHENATTEEVSAALTSSRRVVLLSVVCSCSNSSSVVADVDVDIKSASHQPLAFSLEIKK